jgi:hypothetical protein
MEDNDNNANIDRNSEDYGYPGSEFPAGVMLSMAALGLATGIVIFTLIGGWW